MIAWRGAGALWAPLGLAVVVVAAGVGRTGPHDAAADVSRSSPAAERFRERIAGSSSAAMRIAGFDLPRPLGTLVPTPEVQRVAAYAPNESKLVDRGRKGDLLVPRVQVELTAELLREDARDGTAAPDELEAAQRFVPFPDRDVALSLELNPQGHANATASTGANDPAEEFSGLRLYFGAAPIGATLAAIEPWKDEEPPAISTFVSVRADAAAPDAGEADAVPAVPVRQAAVSPAQRLRLDGAARAKAEKCLANAVYFEARSEPVRGQIAVAQVVLNRTFSGYYPGDVCGVVYQGSHRHLSCQFTFACDGIPDVATEPAHWERATRIAKAALDGQVWLPDVGRATHYHASYVYPYWVRSMRKLQKIGLHSFYRPRRWGDGADAPAWGSAGNEMAAAQF